MKFNKKGQAALEFLTTYGWAFLVILVMIGALGYFGVFDASRFVPDSCKLDGTIECQAFAIDHNALALEIRNNLLESVQITNVSLREQESSTVIWINYPPAAQTIGARSSRSFIRGFANGNYAEFVGDKKNFEVTVYYVRGGAGFNQVSTGTLTTTVQPDGSVI